MDEIRRNITDLTKDIVYIHHLVCHDVYYVIKYIISYRYYCLSAAAALLKYVEFVQNMVYAPGSLKIVFKGSEKTAMIGLYGYNLLIL